MVFCKKCKNFDGLRKVCTGSPAAVITKDGVATSCTDYEERKYVPPPGSPEQPDSPEQPELKNYTKPPLGAKPAHIASSERIKELADAISRTSEDAQNNTVYITLWAKEIVWQCNIIQDAKKEGIII